jgi:hypothetical protein
MTSVQDANILYIQGIIFTANCHKSALQQIAGRTMKLVVRGRLDREFWPFAKKLYWNGRCWKQTLFLQLYITELYVRRLKSVLATDLDQDRSVPYLFGKIRILERTMAVFNGPFRINIRIRIIAKSEVLRTPVLHLWMRYCMDHSLRVQTANFRPNLPLHGQLKELMRSNFEYSCLNHCRNFIELYWG